MKNFNLNSKKYSVYSSEGNYLKTVKSEQEAKSFVRSGGYYEVQHPKGNFHNLHNANKYNSWS